MSELIINATTVETRVALVENGVISDLVIEREKERGLVGNVFKGRVVRVLPGMQACFVDIGLDRAAFLYVGDVLGGVADAVDMFDEDGLVKVEGVNRAPPKVPIQDVVKEGQLMLVQVAKDPIGTKGARLTMHISLPGRYLVYMPTVSHLGVSRRIEQEEERARLKDIVQQLKPDEGGFIVRTACEGASQKDIKNDIEYLTKLWKEIHKAYDKQNGPGNIHMDLDVELRAIRDLFDDNVKRVIVDDPKIHKKVLKFFNQFLPKFKSNIELYAGAGPIFDHFGIELEISRALGRKVWLKSGGYIIVDEAEALVAIDVNTGRYVGKRNLEDTIIKTNLEAVKEIAYQLRLRNCGGIIILDFIDMEKESNREKVLESLKEELAKDRAKTNVLTMSSLGLVEMTRKRTRESLVRTLCEPCSYCDGKGYLKSKTTICYEIFRELAREAKVKEATSSQVHVHPDIADWLYSEEREMLEETEEYLGRPISIKTEEGFHLEQFEVVSKH
ncbi:MAG: Rne/Rng family ribonuclease [Oligoflexia bacterium]|nr:Rne/Rng family ribonuclease [Oligoflexia bacterium]